MSFRVVAVLLALFCMCPQRAWAQERPPSIYDKIWSAMELYRSESNPAVQRVAISGRYHHDFLLLDADQGDLEAQNLRRLRIGPRLTLFRTLTAHVEFELDPQRHDPVYVRLTDAYVEWSRTDRLAVTIGKQGMPFTMEGATSSRNLLTIDRSNLANNMWFPQEYLPGVAFSGETDGWTYHAGVYSAGEANREFGRFNGGVTTLTSVGYDFADALGTRAAALSVNYVYQRPDSDNSFTRQLDHVGSVNLAVADSRWGLQADLALASGYLGQSRLWGAMLMPYINLTGKAQLVGRYTFLDSAETNGIRLATYENRLVGGRGDLYNDVYAGVNYYLYGQRLKIQSGVQFVDMKDEAADGGAYSGVSWVTALRVGW